MTPHPRPAHAQKAQASKCVPKHTHIHTRVRAWHRPGTTGDAPQHMHTRLDRQAAGSVSIGSPSRCLCEEEGSTWLRAAWRGATLLVPLDHFGVPRAGPWRKIPVLLSAGNNLAPPSPSQPLFYHSWLSARCTGFCGLPTATSLSCGIEFSTQFALRVSMPSGGKYKTCLSQTQHGSERVSRTLSLLGSQGSGHRGLGRNER